MYCQQEIWKLVWWEQSWGPVTHSEKKNRKGQKHSSQQSIHWTASRKLANTSRELKSSCWLSKAVELLLLGDTNDMKGFYQSMKIIWPIMANTPGREIWPVSNMAWTFLQPAEWDPRNRPDCYWKHLTSLYLKLNEWLPRNRWDHWDIWDVV